MSRRWEHGKKHDNLVIRDIQIRQLGVSGIQTKLALIVGLAEQLVL